MEEPTEPPYITDIRRMERATSSPLQEMMRERELKDQRMAYLMRNDEERHERRLSDMGLRPSFYRTSEQEKLEAELVELRKKERELAKQVEKAEEAGARKDDEFSRLKSLHEEMKSKHDLAYLLNRVTPLAESQLLTNIQLRQKFSADQDCDAIIVSIDVRRSTDLMLRGKTPQKYAQFLNQLCTELVEVVKLNFGVIDKFTGDGLLAYFPTFFSGRDAGYRAFATAQASHSLFEKHYRAARGSFTSILKDVGLGIGIDYGAVRLLRVNGDLTVVGTAVVYACRLNCAPAGKTYLNHSALDQLNEVCPGTFESQEIVFQMKHEGDVICHEARLAYANYNPADPDWLHASLSDSVPAGPESISG